MLGLVLLIVIAVAMAVALVRSIAGPRHRSDAPVPAGRGAVDGGARVSEHRRPIELVAADLRRLRRAVITDAGDSAVHQIAHRMAYDRVLREACTMLEIPHGLDADEIHGPGREFERLLTEANLQSAGLVLSSEFDRL